MARNHYKWGLEWAYNYRETKHWAVVTMIITRGVDILTCSGNTLITERPPVNASAVQRGRHCAVNNAVRWHAGFEWQISVHAFSLNRFFRASHCIHSCGHIPNVWCGSVFHYFWLSGTWVSNATWILDTWYSVGLLHSAYACIHWCLLSLKVSV